MIKYLDKDMSYIWYSNITFKLIPKSLKPYKSMTVYTIDPKNNRTILTALILLKFADENSLIKIFSLLSALYNFSPTYVTTDFNFSKINTLKKQKHLKRNLILFVVYFIMLKPL